MHLTVYKPGTEYFTEARLNILDELAKDLVHADFEVDREYRALIPGRYGMTFYEVVLIYIGGKFLDSSTGSIADKVIEKIIAVAKKWGVKTYNKKKVRPQWVSLLDEDAKLIAEIKVTKEGAEVIKGEGQPSGRDKRLGGRAIGKSGDYIKVFKHHVKRK